ncbi:MAG: hypothetical protein AABX11_05850 [Nanoarchaeota archaeon]
MIEIGFDEFGKIGETKIVEPQGLIAVKGCDLKFYTILRKENAGKRDIELVKSIIKDEFEYGGLEGEVGMGFVMLSDNTLNIPRWSKDNPTILVNSVNFIYKTQNSGYFAPFRTNSHDLGVSYFWQYKILQHERDAWRAYLLSNKSDQDKQRYLSDFLPRQEIN